VKEELDGLELALCMVRAEIAVEYPKSPFGPSVRQALAHRQLGHWLLEEAEEQERAMLAAMEWQSEDLEPQRADG
jgi:hypothetical protein